MDDFIDDVNVTDKTSVKDEAVDDELKLSVIQLEKDSSSSSFANGKVSAEEKPELKQQAGRLKDPGQKEKAGRPTRRKEPSLKLSLIGFSLGLVSAALSATGLGCAQALEGAVPDFQLASMRGFFQWFVAAALFVINRELPRVKKETAGWMFLRASVTTTSNITNYISNNFIAVGISSCVRRSTALFLVTLLARIVLKEVITVLKALAISLSIVGVILLTQPWYDLTSSELEGATIPTLARFMHFHNFHFTGSKELFISGVAVPVKVYETNDSTVVLNTTTSYPENGDGSSNTEALGYILAVTAGACMTFGQIIQKSKLYEYNSLTLNFYAGMVSTIVPLIISLVAEDITFPSEPDQIALLMVQSVCSGVAIVIGTKAMSLTSPIIVSLAMSLQVVFLLIAQYTVLSHINQTIGNWVEITGAVLVVFSVFLPPGWMLIKSQLKKNSGKKKPRTESNNVSITSVTILSR